MFALLPQKNDSNQALLLLRLSAGDASPCAPPSQTWSIPDQTKRAFLRKERLQAALLGPRFGGMNDARRDKFLMNEAMRDAGLAAARQVKTGDRSKVREFLATLKSKPKPPPPAPSTGEAAGSAGDVGDVDVLLGGNAETAADDGGDGGDDGDDGVLSVVKPARGCASGSVFRCRGEDEAMEAFEKILGTPKYGTPGEFNDEVRKWRDGMMARWHGGKRLVRWVVFHLVGFSIAEPLFS